MTTFSIGTSECPALFPVATPPICSTISIPSVTCPKTQYPYPSAAFALSRNSLSLKLIKNCEVAELGLLVLAIAIVPFLLLILLVISLFILLEFNFKSIVLGLLSVPFVILYPFMKRITFFPQLFLGIIFSWGVLIVSMQFNTRITFDFLLLYFVCIFWTLAYDTIYAYQDKADDVLNKIKSTAVYFDKNGKRFVQTCYLIILIILSYFVWNSSNFLLSSIIIATIAICTYIAIQKWDITSPLSSNYYFRQNNIFAIMLFLLLHTF